MSRLRKPSRGADARQSKQRQNRPAPSRTRQAPAWEVTPNDLGCLDAVRSLLSALNDAYVSTSQLQSLVLGIPVLAARCVKRIGSREEVDAALLDRALTTIGNMGLESELLGLLEDLTTCQADLLEVAERSSIPPV
jgi:hypothetical protein